MNILLNNNNEEVSEGITVEKLLLLKKIEHKYFAVEINNTIVPKSTYVIHVIKNGDKIEIITAVGGG